MIKNIVFDFGGVLLDWNPGHFYKNIFTDNEEMEWFLSNICTDEWNAEQDRGRSFEEGVSILKSEYSEHAKNIELFSSQWEKMLKGEIDGSIQILKELKEKYKIYGLTNWSAETFPIVYQKYDFFKLFDGIVVSGTEKMIKPDQQFFQLLLDRYDLKAEECLFIDDNEKNIQAALDLGFKCVHFNNAIQLRNVIYEFSLL